MQTQCVLTNCLTLVPTYSQLGDAIVLNHQNAAEIAALLLVVEERDRLLVALEEAGAEKDRLNGECSLCSVCSVCGVCYVVLLGRVVYISSAHA